MTAWYMLCLLLIGCPQVFSIILRGPVTGTVDLQLPERVAERRDSINFSGFRIESGPDSYKPQAAMISKGIVHPLCTPSKSGIPCTRYEFVGCMCSFTFGGATSELQRSTETADAITVYIVLMDREDDKLQYIMNPAIATMWNAFRSLNQTKLRIDVRTIRYRDYNYMRERERLYAGLARGDVLIWVGFSGSTNVPWRSLHNRGVYNIVYNTEPLGVARTPEDEPLCVYFRSDFVDEVWVVAAPHATVADAPSAELR